MNIYRRSAFSRGCAGVVAVAMLLQPLAGNAAPITTSYLNETPLQGLNPVKPNIMFTLDDSGSMAAEFSPDNVAFVASDITHCRNTPFQCGGRTTAPQAIADLPFTVFDPPVRSKNYNTIYYDPAATYRPARNADLTLRACEGQDTTCGAPWTAVYQDGFAGYPGSGGLITDLVQGYPDTVWCRASSPSPADLATADSTGFACRRNGWAYNQLTIGSDTTPAIVAGYNYPNPTATCATGQACKFLSPALLNGSPYYYTINQVQYCSAKDADGWGTTPCSDQWDATTFRYVRYGTSNLTFDPQAFTRVDIRATGILVNGQAAANPSGRTYAQEMSNFSNWYAFYRSRMLAMKTATGIAFSALNEKNARVGYHTLWANSLPASGFLNVTPFNSTNKQTWFSHFYATQPALGTPLPDAVWRIGEYFSNSTVTGLPGAADPLDATTGMCQPNYHLLSTDGYWNRVLNTSIGDRDQTVPSLPGPVPAFTTGAKFPRPFIEGTTPTSNNLADLAMHYWTRDLRSDVENKVQDAIAPWQHVVLYGLAIGAQGSVPYPGGINDIISGAKDWPATKSGDPGANLGNLPGPEAIDDLWHAAINSRGKYFNAKTAQELAASIVQSLSEFTSQSGTGTAVGIAGAQISATKNFAYRTSYEVGWWGDLRKYALNLNTGALPVDNAGNPINPPVWSAAAQVDLQAAATGWDTARRIITINDSTNLAVPFRAGNLSAAQRASLNAGWVAANVIPPPSADQVLNYLRGDASNEGVGSTNFRPRAHILGDLVYSGAVPVAGPQQPYEDAGNPGYSSFASAKKSRTPMVYVGGNDGMLHAFNDSSTTDAGKETWAYVPKAMFIGGDPNDSAHMPSPEFQIGALAYGFTGSPLFSPKFHVNATPRIWDIDFANTNTNSPPQSGNDWRTILVGGLGAGGRAIYALDVTDPVGPAETEASIATSGRVLWEKTYADPGFENLGHVFDAPTLVKTRRYGWVALVASGYNNADGIGRLYVLNPTNGDLLVTLSTGVGTPLDPSGLSTIRAFTSSRRDPYALQAYGGDLKGNVWRFDLSDPNESNWKVELIAKLTDRRGTAQPITTGVRIEIDQNNNVDRYLFVGTGKLLGVDERSASGINDIKDRSVTNSLYVIRDGTRTTAEPAPAAQIPPRAPYSRADLNTVTDRIAGFTGPATGRGWYQDASDPSAKIGTDVFADVQTVVFSFSKPSTDPCAPPLSSTLFARDLNTGNSVLVAPNGGIVAGYDIGSGIAGVALIQGAAGASGSAIGEVRAQVTTMKGEVFSFGISLNPATLVKHRVSWRLLNRE